MVSLKGRRRNKYETSPSISYDDEEDEISENKSVSTSGYTTATSGTSGEESDSRFAVESNMTSTIAASSGDVSLNSSDIADIVKVSKSKTTKKKKKRNKKVNDNYLNSDDEEEEDEEGADSFSNDDVEEEKSIKSNISKASIKSNISKSSIRSNISKASTKSNMSKASTKSNMSMASSNAPSKASSKVSMKFLSRKKKNKLTTSISMSSSKEGSATSSKDGNSRTEADDDENEKPVSEETTQVSEEGSSSKENNNNDENNTNISSSSTVKVEPIKVITKKKRKKKHKDKLKLQTYDYYGEECFEIVKTEVPFSDDDEEDNVTIKSKKSHDSITSSKAADKHTDTSEVSNSDSKNDKNIEKEEISQGHDSEVEIESNEVVSSSSSKAEQEEVIVRTEELEKDEVANKGNATETEDEKESTEEQEIIEIPATKKKSSKRAQMLSYTKKALLTSTITTKKKLMKVTASSSSSEDNSNGKKKKIKFSGIMKKSLISNKHKQKKLASKAAIEDVDDVIDEEKEKDINVEDQPQQEQEEEKGDNNNNKKAITIVDDKESSEEKKFILDEICKDDLTQLISVLTLSFPHDDDDDDNDEKNEDQESIKKKSSPKVKTTQRDILKLLNILESYSAGIDDDTKNSIIRNRYSLSCDNSTNKEGGEGKDVGGDAKVLTLIESLKTYKPEEKDDLSNTQLSTSVQKLSSQLIAIEENNNSVMDNKTQDENITPSTEDNTNTNNYVPTSPDVVVATKTASILSPIETAWADGNIPEATSAMKKKKNYTISPRKALKKKFVRFKEHLESPRSATSYNNDQDKQPELIYETVKMIIVTASIILKQSGFDVKSAEEASALMLEEELIKLSSSIRNNSNKPWFKLNKASAADKKDASSNAKEVSQLTISALCSGIGTMQATELAANTLRSKGYKVTDKEPLPEGEIEEDSILVMDPPRDADNDVEGQQNPQQEQLNGTNSVDLVLETFPQQKGCLVSSVFCSSENGNNIPTEVTASSSPAKKKKKKHQQVEKYDEYDDEDYTEFNDSTHLNDDSTNDATSSLLITKRSKSPKKSPKKNIKVYHNAAGSETSPERSEYSSAFNDSETGSSFIGKSEIKDETGSNSSVEESANNINMKKKGSPNNEDEAASTSINTSTYIKKCTEYDQPAFDDYMSTLYYQMMEDVEKYKVYHDVVNAFNNSKSFLGNKCNNNDANCCGLAPAATSTVGGDETTYDKTDTVTNTAEYTLSTFETNTLEDSPFSKENTLTSDEVEKRNELETTAINDNNVDTNNTTEREDCSPLSSPQTENSPKNPIVNTNVADAATMNKNATKGSKLKKQPSINKKLFKGLKKVF